MGNPKRYMFDKHFIRRPEVDEEKKQVTIVCYDEKSLLPHYEKAVIDFYSAPDLISPYTNGNTCKDEWRRYFKYVFTNLKLIKCDETGLDDQVFTLLYSYEVYEFQNCSTEEEMTSNIPMGKFAGMSYKQVQDYKRKNRMQWDKPPEPSSEAIEAACNAQPSLPWPMGAEEMKVVLMAAYKIDM